MTSVSLGDDARVHISFELEEATMLADLALQIAELISESTEDASFARLFPAAYRDDAAAAAEFERFERAGLADGKVAAARAVHAAASIGDVDTEADSVDVDLDPADVWPWLTHLTDVRTVLADRLGIDSDGQEVERGAFEDDEVSTLIALYDWLGWLQGSIIAALEGGTA